MLATGTPLVVTDYPTAELVKAAANAFLATKISFINAMAEVCEASGADVTKLADAIGYDDRIGRKFLNSGLGFGGGCLPKDIRAFMARAGELGASDALGFLKEIDQINMRRRVRMVDLAREVCGGSIIGRRVAVLGAAFKPNSDDIRDSPALNVAAQMQLQGASRGGHRPEGDRERPPGLAGHHLRADRAGRGAGRRRGAAAHRVVRVPASSTRRSSARWSTTGGCSTAATRSTRTPGARPAGPTARWAARRPSGRVDPPELIHPG